MLSFTQELGVWQYSSTCTCVNKNMKINSEGLMAIIWNFAPSIISSYTTLSLLFLCSGCTAVHWVAMLNTTEALKLFVHQGSRQRQRWFQKKVTIFAYSPVCPFWLERRLRKMCVGIIQCILTKSLRVCVCTYVCVCVCRWWGICEMIK